MRLWQKRQAKQSCRIKRHQFGLVALALSAVLLLQTAISARADPLDCTEFFSPSTDTSFPFAWRGDRCEGFVQQKTSFRPESVKISYFGYGDLDRTGPRIIANRTDTEFELRGDLKSRNTFYRLIARLAPGQSIEWHYPKPLIEAYGDRPDRIGMLAAKTGTQDAVLRPFTVSNATELKMGIVSTDFRFNSAEVIIYDGEHSEICRRTYNFHRVVSPLVQQTFALNLCGKSLATVRRISVVAMLKLPGSQPKETSRDVIWIE